MRRPRPPRRIVLAAAAAGALAAAAAGCGREGDLAGTDATTPTPTTTTLTEPATGTTPLTRTTPKRGRQATRTTPTPPQDGTRTTRTTPQKPPSRTATTPARTTPRDPNAALPEDERLRRAAAEHARNTFSLPVTSGDVTLVRSRRKPRWAIASGTYGRTPWVVWLRDGKVALGTTNAARFNPIGVPCDVRPAFSEPSC